MGLRSASAVSRLGFVLLSPGEDRGSLLASGFLFVGATKENICGMWEREKEREREEGILKKITKAFGKHH